MMIGKIWKRFFPGRRRVERRGSERSALSLPIQIVADDQRLEAMVVEMSPGGARIHLGSALAPGQSLKVQFLAGGIRLPAHCRWTRPRPDAGWMAGIQFDPGPELSL